MRVASKILCALVVAAVLCTMLSVTAFAAETGNLWLNNVTDNQQGSTAVVVYADTTVTNGMVELHYDSSKLTYSSVSVSEDYVGVFAVNADTEGVVKIAWVAPGPYETDGSDIALITVNFVGNAGKSAVTASGNVYDADGQLVNIVSAPQTDPDDGSADTGDAIAPIMGLMLLSAAAVAVALVSNKKGWWTK